MQRLLQKLTASHHEVRTRSIFFALTIIVFWLASYHAGFAQSLKPATDGSKRAAHAVPDDALYKSPIQLALSKDGSTLYTACENTNEVLAINTRSEGVVRKVAVGKHPFGLALSPDEQCLYVSNRWDDTVSVVDTESLRLVQSFPVGDDPHGLVSDHSGRYLFVTNLGTDDVSVIETERFTEIKRLPAGRAPFAVALSPDGRYVYVSNQFSNPVPFRTPPVLELTVIDVKNRVVAGRPQLHSTVIGQGLAVSPDNRFVVVSLALPKNLIPETQIYQGWMVTHGFALLEQGPHGRAAYLLLDEPNQYFSDPYGVVFSPDGRYLYISSSAVDTVSVVDMEKVFSLLSVQDATIGISDETISLYARNLALSTGYVISRIPTQVNPKGMVVSPDGRWVYVANRLSDSITVIDAHRQAAVKTIGLGGPNVETTLRRGERLFNYASISFQRQLSCNTCHPEYHLDGLIYDIAIDGGMGRNLVDNLSLRGIAFTAPYKWSGKNPDLYRQEGPRAAQLFFRSHGFEPEDQEAIVRFIESIPFTKNRYLSPDGKLDEFQERGKELFERAYTNKGLYIPVSNRCSTCHPPPLYTDRMKHDVGSKAYCDTDAEFDTPQLTNIYEKQPYMHDGRCYSLEEIWTVYNPDDLHGVTNDMKKEQLNDLIEFIKVLPLNTEVGAETDPAQQVRKSYHVEIEELSEPVIPPAQYMGNQSCKRCHAEDYSSWVASKHARAYVVLQTEMARKIASEAKIKAESPRNSAQCLTCHATASTAPERYRSKDFRIEEGVKCEACHGPGEKYGSTIILKTIWSWLRPVFPSAEGKTAGLHRQPTEDPRSKGFRGRLKSLVAKLKKQLNESIGLRVPRMPGEKECLVCHEPEDSHAMLKKTPFVFEEAWKKIKH